MEPAGVEIGVAESETLFDAAWREGYDWPTVCFGQAQCTHCHVRVTAGADNTRPSSEPNEAALVRRIGRRLYGGDEAGIRLACRLHVTGEVVVERTDFTGSKRSSPAPGDTAP